MSPAAKCFSGVRQQAMGVWQVDCARMTARRADAKEMRALPTGPAEPAGARRVCGEVAEWLKAHAWKVCLRETVTRVRIPLSPPSTLLPLNYMI